MFTFTTDIQHCTGSYSQENQARKIKIKGIETGKEEVKLSPFADAMILYMENLKESIKKLLQLINKFSKVAVYKINTEKSVAFLNTNNEQSEKEIKKTISFKYHPKE